MTNQELNALGIETVDLDKIKLEKMDTKFNNKKTKFLDKLMNNKGKIGIGLGLTALGTYGMKKYLDNTKKASIDLTIATKKLKALYAAAKQGIVEGRKNVKSFDRKLTPGEHLKTLLEKNRLAVK